MLFSDKVFLLYFLPVVLVLFHFAKTSLKPKYSLYVLLLSSLFFYGYWKPIFSLLLIGSVLFNFFILKQLRKDRKILFSRIGISVNLLCLGYFKYSFFIKENFFLMLGKSIPYEEVFIPLAISFYTFQQIAMIIDVRDDLESTPSFLHYSSFVVLFPQLIAGPIVLFKELKSQFLKIEEGKLGESLFGRGLVVFIFGLFKKSCIADSIAPYSDIAFSNVETITFLESWVGIILYSFQLYFDFSGYSDMAVGIGLMFGLVLPFNFNRPYLSVSMISFWKRWHITMTRFFMVYVFTPISLFYMRKSIKNNYSFHRRFFLTTVAPIFITFLFSGLWHGAGWNFIVFGLVNALGLLVNHIWKQYKLYKPHFMLSWIATYVTVLVSFVYFRAMNIEEANSYLKILFQPSTFKLPQFLSTLGNNWGLHSGELSFFSSGTFFIKIIFWLILGGASCFFIPDLSKSFKQLKGTWGLAFAVSIFMWIIIAWIDEPKTFIYFQF